MRLHLPTTTDDPSIRIGGEVGAQNPAARLLQNRFPDKPKWRQPRCDSSGNLDDHCCFACSPCSGTAGGKAVNIFCLVSEKFDFLYHTFSLFLNPVYSFGNIKTAGAWEGIQVNLIYPFLRDVTLTAEGAA